MSGPRIATTARAIVDDVFGRGMTREIWTSNYEKALPVSVQGFDLTAVLPAVFYMFRFGHRRGKGKFLETFGRKTGPPRERRKTATIERVAVKLAETEFFEGFQDDVTRAILGDLLLCFCLENTKRALGRDEQVQRVAPAHYMASWVDLPDSVAHLRYVPETIVAMLADQKGEYVHANQEDDKSWFAIGRGLEDNVLLQAFHQGVVRDGRLSDRKADRFQEGNEVALDQLLMIRLAQQLGAAPDKLRGGEGDRISNQRPIAERAARQFSEDIRGFVRGYAGVIPRRAFVELLESCIAVGLTVIVTSVIELLFEWAATGELRKKCDQAPTPLFVDCSNGLNLGLRALAEQSLGDFMRRIEQFSIVLMGLRLLDHGARYDRRLKKLHVATRPYATDWLNLLGELLHQRREEAGPVLDYLERKAGELAERVQEDYPEAAEILGDDRAEPNPVWRLAEALTFLQGRKGRNNIVSLLDSAFMTGRPNGLARRRSVTRNAPGGTARRSDLRHLAFTDSVLDYLVHRHVLLSGNKEGYRLLSFKDFMRVLHERYGFCVDVAPPGMTISNELLRANRVVLERRLRDLGLLMGVNDAEAMKHLQPRFERLKEHRHGAD